MSQEYMELFNINIVEVGDGSPCPSPMSQQLQLPTNE